MGVRGLGVGDGRLRASRWRGCSSPIDSVARARRAAWAVRTRSESSAAGCGGCLRSGFPAATQVTLEVGVFAAATALAGRLAPSSLAAHQIALNIAAFTFMVPLGVASAGAVRVGHARRPPRSRRARAARAGRRCCFGVGFMAIAARAVPRGPAAPDRPSHRTRRCWRSASTLLFVAAVFQLFDGLQGVATGALRGLGDTRTPML